MRIIVTGGLGFIGSHLSDRLVADGHAVTVLDDRSTPAVCDVPGAEVITAGICEWDGWRSRDFDLVYHLASPVGPLGVIGWRGRLAPEVVGCAAVLARYAVRHRIRLVDVSTSEIYGSGGMDCEDDDCTFRAPTSARKEYAVAKLAAETMLRNTPGLDTVIVRPFNVAGPRQRAEGGFVLPRFIGQALAGEPLTVYQPGTQRRAFTHVADIVEGLILAAERGAPGEAYNLGNPANSCAILELAQDVLSVTGSPSPITIVDPRRLHGEAFAEAPDKIPNAAKAMRDLGWMPSRGRLQTIADALAVAA